MRIRMIVSKLARLMTGPVWATARPDVLRREALFFNTLLMVAAVVAACPIAVLFLTQGSVLPITAVMVAAALTALAFAMHVKRRFELELACHVALIGSIGILLTLSDPDIVDFGLAVALMAPLNALLVSQSRYKHLAWTFPALALCLGSASAAGLLVHPFQAGGSAFIAAAAFVTAIFIVAVTANRLNTMASATSRTHMKTFSMLLENVQDAVVRYGPDGEIRFLSKSASDVFGCQRFELNGNGMFERIHVMDRPAYMAALSDAGTRGVASTVEIRMRRDSGAPGEASRYFWVEFSLSPVVDEPGLPGRWEVLGILRDISARKDSEAETNRARVDAEQASEAKSRFLATIGHELRTPLSAIVGFSDMMKEGIGGKLSPTHEEYAGLIRQSGQHLLEVVNMLLDMSKIEAGKFEIQTDVFAPEGLVEPCVQLVEKAGRGRNITIEADVPDTLPQIVGDERACRQMLINLLSNAVKFSHEGGVVTLSMRRQGKMLNISVSDAGIGMESEIIERIGEPFLQAQDGLSRQYEGTGLGLSIVKGLVALHEGRLHVTSQAGVGTRITILLPIAGPAHANTPTAEITRLHKNETSNDEAKWLEDEKRSAAI